MNPQNDEEYKKQRDAASPKYDGTTCSSTRRSAWIAGADWAYTYQQKKIDALKAREKKLEKRIKDLEEEIRSAIKYLGSIGIDKIEQFEPEKQMLVSFKFALSGRSKALFELEAEDNK